MRLLLLWSALVHPRRLSEKIACTHEHTRHEAMIDTGMRKMWWCSACDATWFMGGLAA